MHKFYGVQAVKVGFERDQLVAEAEKEPQSWTFGLAVHEDRSFRLRAAEGGHGGIKRSIRRYGSDAAGGIRGKPGGGTARKVRTAGGRGGVP